MPEAEWQEALLYASQKYKNYADEKFEQAAGEEGVTETRVQQMITQAINSLDASEVSY